MSETRASKRKRRTGEIKEIGGKTCRLEKRLSRYSEGSCAKRLTPEKPGVGKEEKTEKGTIYVSIYAPNEPKQQVSFLNELSNSFVREYINENVTLGGDFNCVITAWKKKGGKPFDTKKKGSVVELENVIKTNNLVDSWHFKNPADLCGFT